ncbi:NitrOD5 domain-containing protein [Thermococcus sp. JCM 11816]|uniref:NitrOD5 domain-containing protein n=1 Tax=Thermococcus sp. (strain JCM 11816 / KS-1) TaxID=1295125 RepID=UPI0006D00BF5
MNEGQNVIVKAVVHSVEKANPTLKSLLELHLKNTTGGQGGFELAYNDPKRFKEAVSKLFGEYSARLLEMLIISYFREKAGLMEEVNTLEELVEYIQRVYR